jgi:D-xylose transport system substrate-binding protein
MARRHSRWVLAAVGLLAAGCSGKPAQPEAKQAAAPAEKPPDALRIGLLLPESKTTRYESFDRPLFEAKVKALCAGCEVVYFNADQDAAKQQSQVEAALTQGVKVLVLDAVDAGAVGPLVARAKQRGIPVIAYDRLITGVAYDGYVSFDNVKVGEVQGEALLRALDAKGTAKKGKIVMIHGAPTDPSSADYKKGAHQALDGKVTIGKEYDTPDWSPDKAQQEMEQAIVALGKKQIVGVYAANDGTAGGAIAALKRAGFKELPPITGQDAELGAVQRILTGEQHMTVYLDIRAQAEQSATLAVSLAKGEAIQAPTTVDNGTARIPSWLLDPVPVTRDRVKDTIVKDGFYKVAEICTADVAKACAELALQ